MSDDDWMDNLSDIGSSKSEEEYEGGKIEFDDNFLISKKI